MGKISYETKMRMQTFHEISFKTPNIFYKFSWKGLEAQLGKSNLFIIFH